VRPYLKKNSSQKRAGGVAQGVGPESNPSTTKKYIHVNKVIPPSSIERNERANKCGLHGTQFVVNKWQLLLLKSRVYTMYKYIPKSLPSKHEALSSNPSTT
jgi:hypothetical protein